MNPTGACRRTREGLTEYLENALSPRRRQGLEEHLANCEGCRGYLQELQGVIAALGDAPAAGMPVEMRVRLLERLRDG